MPSTSPLTTAELEDLATRRASGYSWPAVRDLAVMWHREMAGISYQSVRGAVVRHSQYGSRSARRVARTYSGLTFGIEIEFRRPNDSNGYRLDERVIAQAIQDAGIECQYEDYNHNTRPYWKLIYDGSSDKELVSPILCGADGLEQVRKVMQVLRNLGCRVTRSEGMHVHVGAGHLSAIQIHRIAAAYTVNSHLFDSVLARTRRQGGSGYRWCAHMTSRELAEVRQHADRGSVYGYDRYRSVNLRAYAQHGTIEFRQHQGSLNGTKATAWVTLLTAFVDHVAALDAETPNTRYESFEEMATAINLDRRTTRYFTRRAAALAPTVGAF